MLVTKRLEKPSCILLLFLAGACSDLSTPADLDREQVLAVRASPPVLLPGGSVVLDTLVAGPQGPLLGSVSWQLPLAIPGVSISELPSGETLLSCADGVVVDEAVQLNIAIELGDGQVLLAQKSVSIENQAAENPMIRAIRIEGIEVAPDESVAVETGERVISVDVDAATRVAWYSSLGEIQYYRSAETILELQPEDTGGGWIAAVVRDEDGGVSWQSFRIEVD
jgi:hypothetical protein